MSREHQFSNGRFVWFVNEACISSHCSLVCWNRHSFHVQLNILDFYDDCHPLSMSNLDSETSISVRHISISIISSVCVIELVSRPKSAIVMADIHFSNGIFINYIFVVFIGPHTVYITFSITSKNACWTLHLSSRPSSDQESPRSCECGIRYAIYADALRIWRGIVRTICRWYGISTYVSYVNKLFAASARLPIFLPDSLHKYQTRKQWLRF